MTADKQRRSRVRSASEAFACPACQTHIGPVERCPNCHFTGSDTMAMFGGSPPPVAPVNDLAGLWDEAALKAIAKARKRANGRFPQFRWSLCSMHLPPETNLRLYGFWMLNAYPLAEDESENNRLWTVLLLINAAANKAAVIPAYAAEPWLGSDQWDKLLAGMSPSWKNGDSGRAAAGFIHSSVGLLESAWRQAAAIQKTSRSAS